MKAEQLFDFNFERHDEIGFKEYMIATWANGVMPDEILDYFRPLSCRHVFNALIDAVAVVDYRLAKCMYNSAYSWTKLDGKLSHPQR